MNRSWTTILLIAGLTGLLVLSGALQYRWLRQISESDNEKAHRRVQEQAERFAMDFNREIQNSYFNFQTGPDTWAKKDWLAFNERYDYWREKTAYPELITGFHFLETGANAVSLKYDRGSRTFVPVEENGEIVDLRKRFADSKNFRAVQSDIYTLLLPIHGEGHKTAGPIMIRTPSPDNPPSIAMPPTVGYLAIKLDPTILKDNILRDLTAKYFADNEFRASVTDKAGASVFQSVSGDARDATVPLFNVAPDNFIFYANKDLMDKIGERRSDVMVSQKVETHSFNRIESNTNKDGGVKIEIKKEGLPRTSVFTATTTTSDRPGDSPWTLNVQHVYGSLDAFTASNLRRNLAIGFGLLFLLACAIVAIIISAQLVKRTAQRQVDFVSSVSHEFRTPLAVIYSAGENLADGVAKEDGQVSRYGDLIKGEGRKLSGMVEQILDFAGANSGKKKYTLAETAVSEVITDAIDACRPLIDEKSIAIETNIAELPSINADKNALTQAVQNLLINSAKYSNGGTKVRVNAENGGGNIKISVEDEGIGISKSDLRQVFEPFYRSREVVDAQIHGNGLGLSLVKQIVEAHGGKAMASSEPGKGSTFTIELPV
ncbi:MAG: HAMP domain-containing sensor histidine kinase [Pyrinomonadaceae bacterium]